MIYRNPGLLALAAKAPHCFGCWSPNYGDVVAAHSNKSADGKGMGIKASDAAVAFCCHVCHAAVDLRTARAPDALWERMHRATMIWLVESGHLAVNTNPEPYVAPPKKPGRKIRSKRTIQSAPMQSAARPFPAQSFQKPKTKHLWPTRPFPQRRPA